MEIHGFKRLAVGEKFGGSYTHSLFVRGQANTGNFIIKTQKIKRTKLGRGSSAPLPHPKSRQLHSKSTSPSKNPGHERTSFCSLNQITSQPQNQPKEKKVPEIANRSNSSNRRVLFDEDLELLPHAASGVVGYGSHGRRVGKKHKSNNSLSPDQNKSEDSAAISEWLSSPFGGNDDQEVFRKIIDVGDVDDTHSIHSFSSLPMSEEAPPLDSYRSLLRVVKA